MAVVGQAAELGAFEQPKGAIAMAIADMGGEMVCGPWCFMVVARVKKCIEV